MPLSHAILGFLDYGPMSGYDLKKLFDQSVAHFWSATQSHIYKALENLESEGMVESRVIQQEGKPNRKQYKITNAGRTELRRWVSTPLPVESNRAAWLIQVFFAHNLTNEEIANLFEKRIERLRTSLSECQMAQNNIDKNYQKVGIKRLRNLWQLTLDYGVDYYENEIDWLEKTLPVIRKLPPLTPPKK
ncbi:MAG TPA: PadR family transcriptional regulator [Anaerolineales bacterium]|nr:PadR family transcriptional regulator [Anaerolineales bacterium]